MLVHGLEIVDAGPTVQPSKAHDFAQLIMPLLPDLGAMADRATRRAASGLELYVMARLEGTVGNAPWLDGLPLYAGTAICESIGMVDRFGREARATKLSESEWAEAGDCGFRIASRGEARIREFMKELLRTYPYSRSATEGPQAVLGGFFSFWLSARRIRTSTSCAISSQTS